MYNFVSSHLDSLEVSTNGQILTPREELTDWLCDIHKVDIEELSLYHKNMFGGDIGDGDVLDFAYWDKEGNYHHPEWDWRENTYHNVNVSKENRDAILKEQVKWIKENR